MVRDEKKEEWLAHMSAQQLEDELKAKSKHVRAHAARYFLEYEDKSVRELEWRKGNIAAQLLINALKLVEQHVHGKGEQAKARKHMRRTVLLLTLADG